MSRLHRMLLLAATLASAAARVDAQQLTAPPSVTTVGQGDQTYVLLAGIVGGVAGYQRLATRLVAAGYRVVIIDPYALSVDSSDVSFAALARRVDRVLEQMHVTDAHVVGHSHGAGVALRVAASYPKRVRDLSFLDAGAFVRQQTNNMSASVRLAPYLARLPGGRSLIWHHLAAGLRDHSGTREWFDAATERAYVQPVVDNIDRATALASRLCSAREPEEVGHLIATLRAPVTVILGEFPHTSGPDSSDVEALRQLPGGLFVARLAGVGHFPHEEAPDVVARILTTPRVLASGGR